jgi:2-polyprenyl-6-methoxyphenol hydroxylase-like FAD-dependent oxidoreductase
MATRARSIFLRPEARDYMHELTGERLGLSTTIRHVENTLRTQAVMEGVPTRFHSVVTGVRDRGDHVEVTYRDLITGKRHTVDGSYFVDASGGRIDAVDSGVLARKPNGRSHVLVTAQFASAPKHSTMWGVHDKGTDEIFACYPMVGDTGFVAYLDLPPGVKLAHDVGEQRLLATQGFRSVLKQDVLARFESVAGPDHLDLGEPTSAPQAFDALQHLADMPVAGRIIRIGDSAGNADPYIGAGVAAGLDDARRAATALLADDPQRALLGAARQIRAGHRNLEWRAQLMKLGRRVFSDSLPQVSFDSVRPDQARPTPRMDRITRALAERPIHPKGHSRLQAWAWDRLNGAMSALTNRLAQDRPVVGVPAPGEVAAAARSIPGTDPAASSPASIVPAGGLHELFPAISPDDVYIPRAGAHLEHPLHLPFDVPFPGEARMTAADAHTMSWDEVRYAPAGRLKTFDGRMAVHLDGDRLRYKMAGKVMGFVPYHAVGSYRVTAAHDGYLGLQLEGGSGRQSSMSISPVATGVYNLHFEWETPLGMLVEDGLGGPAARVGEVMRGGQA